MTTFDTTTIKMVLAASVATIAATAPSACSAKSNSEAMTGSIGTTVVALPDGRGLTCAIYAPNSDIAAIDCDWRHASADVQADADTPLAAKVIQPPSGDPVLCVIYAVTSSSGAIDCDWPTA